ncbi:MAG: helix-turn-helix domain-containing protein [Bdellovibrio sp.]|nr:helix-turn-helix domain-containing protein [Bdellovibrio sp.]
MNILEQALALPLENQMDDTDLKLRSLIIKRWLRTDEIGLYLGITPGAVRVMVHRGQLKPRKYCGRNYFNREEIDGLIEASNPDKRRMRWL